MSHPFLVSAVPRPCLLVTLGHFHCLQGEVGEGREGARGEFLTSGLCCMCQGTGTLFGGLGHSSGEHLGVCQNTQGGQRAFQPGE